MKNPFNAREPVLRRECDQRDDSAALASAGIDTTSGPMHGVTETIRSALAAGGLTETAPRFHSESVIDVAGTPHRKAVQAVPVIVFHGDRDHTVQQTNGAYIAQQARDAHSAQATDGSLHVSKHAGVAPGGQRFSRTVHADTEGRARIESWTLHGAGHAWSGGHASGSYTEGTGPDASAEMVRFFMALPLAGSA